MVAGILLAAGWTGQACFFSRFFVQWLASERARRSVVPRVFWWLSLVGALLVGTYTVWRGEVLLLAGYAVGGAISARNLALRPGAPGRVPGRPWTLAVLGAVALVLAIEWHEATTGGDETLAWLVVGGLGQTLWSTRFPLQWWFSERTGHSHFPPVFWWISLAGNGLLLAYALHLGDPVYVLGFLPGPLVQVRNLMLGRTPGRSALSSP
jgi:lipid-A-disaccharide synthase-like uncharacterized protein